MDDKTLLRAEDEGACEMRTVFFTGATGGLGTSCVKELSCRGWKVFAAGTNDDKLRELAALPNVVPVKTDVTDLESIYTALETVKAHTDRLDAVVNFAGLTSFTSMIEGDSIAVTKKLFDVNVMGSVMVNYVFFDMLLKAKGRIVNCSSEAGWMTAQPFAAPYFMSKRALEAYNDSLRRELLYLGIPVIKIQPGPFRTNITKVIAEDFEEVIASSGHYADLLLRVRPLIGLGLKQQCTQKKLVLVLTKALEARKPKLGYRVGTSRLLLLLELLPDRVVDWIYRVIYRTRRQRMTKADICMHKS